MIRRPGRRPAGSNTREAIVAAAGRLFAEAGYDATTLRAVARAAEVDPALVYHYFGDKPALFVATFHLPVDPRMVKLLSTTGEGPHGERVVERFLAQWETGPDAPGTAFRTVVQAMASSDDIARSFREFLTERVWGQPEGVDADEWLRRRALVSSQLVGVAWARYILRLEPLASASRAQVAQWVGPVIDRYRSGEQEPG